MAAENVEQNVESHQVEVISDGYEDTCSDSDSDVGSDDDADTENLDTDRMDASDSDDNTSELESVSSLSQYRSRIPVPIAGSFIGKHLVSNTRNAWEMNIEVVLLDPLRQIPL